ncbi:hypothetical protein [Flavobacterium sp.]|jgi:hypothetical protein|uniref:hypothetical protein n=1 Tax=Flavobacterium sp. TaxID=239 RepID=UPI0037BE6706
MNKTKNSNFPLFLAENTPSFPANSFGLFNTTLTNVVVNFTNIESITIDLPIAYANIRV